MVSWESLKAVLEVVDIFGELEIPYHVGGSLASSVHGVPRQTNDLDLVADLPLAAVPILVLRLQDRRRRATRRPAPPCRRSSC